MNLPESTDTVLDGFHPAVSAWFGNTFPSVTGAQAQAWPLIRQRRSTLIAAPTGSGKTLTAFLAVLDDLVHQGLANGGQLPDETLVVYVSPLRRCPTISRSTCKTRWPASPRNYRRWACHR